MGIDARTNRELSLPPPSRILPSLLSTRPASSAPDVQIRYQMDLLNIHSCGDSPSSQLVSRAASPEAWLPASAAPRIICRAFKLNVCPQRLMLTCSEVKPRQWYLLLTAPDSPEDIVCSLGYTELSSGLQPLFTTVSLCFTTRQASTGAGTWLDHIVY